MKSRHVWGVSDEITSHFCRLSVCLVSLRPVSGISTSLSRVTIIGEFIYSLYKSFHASCSFDMCISSYLRVMRLLLGSQEETLTFKPNMIYSSSWLLSLKENSSSNFSPQHETSFPSSGSTHSSGTCSKTTLKRSWVSRGLYRNKRQS